MIQYLKYSIFVECFKYQERSIKNQRKLLPSLK
jgi:hypothetical protein